jgi:hypothetical protein
MTNRELFEVAPVTVTSAPLAVRVPDLIPLDPTTTLPTATGTGETLSCPAQRLSYTPFGLKPTLEQVSKVHGPPASGSRAKTGRIFRDAEEGNPEPRFQRPLISKQR